MTLTELAYKLCELREEIYKLKSHSQEINNQLRDRVAFGHTTIVVASLDKAVVIEKTENQYKASITSIIK